MKITTKLVECTELRIHDVKLGLFTPIDSWNGLTKLKRVTDENYLIIGGTDRELFPVSIGRLFGVQEEQETYLVSGSPDLIAEIKTIDNEIKKKESK